MANGNPKLADVLAQRGEPEEILRALVDGGVLIVTNPDGSVLVGQLEDESVVLAAFTSPDNYSEKPENETFQQADAALLLEIARTGDVEALVVDPEGEDAALIPFSDVQGFLIAQGMSVDEDVEVAFRPSEHELVPSLREGITARLGDFPVVERVWISDVRMPSGVEGIMLHVMVQEGADPQVANELLQATMEDLPPSNIPVFAHIGDEETEGFLTEMNAAVVRR
ncbi:SseB family protein [Actinoallomurus acaciae]|uniref:SseB family protein n=1 Tax=Actinoallomurus acaciae TaxID=502577 RepID=A0ABV5YM55_9ACTN